MLFPFRKRKSKKDTPEVNNAGTRRIFSRGNFFILVVFFIIVSIFFSSPFKCRAYKYDYTQEQINELKKGNSWNNGKYWTDSALTDVQNNYSWTDLQKMRGNLYDMDIISAAGAGQTAEQALDANFKTKMEGTADVASGVNAPGRSILADIILTAVIGVLQVILILCKELVSTAAFILDKTLDPTLYNLVNQPVITVGWAAVRDVCNLLFLLVLLFIAFCTILQIEKYHLKKTLLMLVIMALLINFSKPIAIFIFDGSQLLMNYFLSALKGDNGYSAGIANISKIADIVYENTKYFDNPSPDKLVIAVEFLFSVIFLFMFAVALFVLAIFLIIRLVAIWLIIIVSPLAFFATAVPDFKKLSSDWWDALFKYSYFGPAAAFFLWLSTKLNMETVLAGNSSNTSDAAVTWVVQTILPYCVTLVFLYASIIMAQKFGIQFASEVTKVADKAIKGFAGTVSGYRAARWGAKKAGEGIKYGAKAGLKWGERKWLMPHGLSPRAAWQGWKQRAEEVDQKSLRVATGKARDFFHREVDGTSTNFEQLEIDRLKMEEMKRYKEHADDFEVLGDEMTKLIGSDIQGAQEKLCGIFRIAYGNRDQDEIAGFIRKHWDDENLKLGNGMTFEELFSQEIEIDGIKRKFTKDDITADGFDVSNMVERMLASTQKGEKKDAGYINKELSDLGQIAAGNGGIGFGAVKRGAGGKLVRTEKKEQAFKAAKKHQTVFETQDRAKKTHRNWDTNEYTSEANDQGLDALRYTSLAEISQVDRTSPSRLEQSGQNDALNEDFYLNLAGMREKEGFEYIDSSGNEQRKFFEAWNPERKNAAGEIDPGVTHIYNEEQAYTSAAYRAALQMAAGVSTETVYKQLNKYKFDVERINGLLTRAKRTPIPPGGKSKAAGGGGDKDQAPEIEVVTERAPRSRTVYDQNGKPIVM
ncbi:MAG: hypothetical protein WC831_04080 [Parcubacteria group bacterium]|jgi:hypothetical protein